MAGLCDVAVNDAFGTAHRAEATTHGTPGTPRSRAPAVARRELDALGKALAKPARPLVAIAAGQGVDSCRATHLASIVDTLIVGGGIASTFILAAGGHIGKSSPNPAQ